MHPSEYFLGPLPILLSDKGHLLPLSFKMGERRCLNKALEIEKRKSLPERKAAEPSGEKGKRAEFSIWELDNSLAFWIERRKMA